jgi:LemA protein
MIKAIGCLVVIVLLVLVTFGWFMSVNNRLVQLEQGVDAQWAQVENAYQRRADLIPNLVATVRGAAQFEQTTLQEITEARASVGQAPRGEGVPDNPEEFARWQAAQDRLSGALGRLLVVMERYPDLKATQAFRDLMTQLEGTENRVSVERVRFNETARDYNTARAQFPASVVAGFRGFKEKAYFRAAPGAEQAPKVEFNFGSPSPAAPPAAAPPVGAPSPVGAASPLSASPAASPR